MLSLLAAQGLGNAGTVRGTVTDPTGGVMQAVDVTISSPLTGFTRTATTDAMGTYSFGNLAPQNYHLAVEVQGFQPISRDVEVRGGVPITLDLTLQLAATTAEVQVVGHAEDLVERDPTAHTDLDQSLIEKLPIETGTGGLNQVVMMASPGVVADSNGFFHPVGDHAQTQFSIDNQPITDQQSRLYSNQISEDAVQSLEIITGVAPAEYGDKSSLVVHIVTKSGLDAKLNGSASVGYGSFRSPSGELNLGGGSHAVGDFLSLSGLRTDRFLDPPELAAIHDQGSNVALFNRVDLRPSGTGTIHLNVQAANSGFDVPNTYDQINQAQHQDITTYNVAPGYSQAVLRGWFDEPAGWIEERTKQHQAIRDDLLKVFRAVPALNVRTPEAGSYLFPRLPKLDVPLHGFVKALRTQAGVTVTPGTEFSPDTADSVRLNFSQNPLAAVSAAGRIAQMIDRYRAR